MVTDNMPLFGLNLTLEFCRDMSNNNLGGSDIPYNLPPNLQSLWVMYSCLYVYLIIPIYVLKNIFEVLHRTTLYAEILKEITSLGQYLTPSPRWLHLGICKLPIGICTKLFSSTRFGQIISFTPCCRNLGHNQLSNINDMFSQLTNLTTLWVTFFLTAYACCCLHCSTIHSGKHEPTVQFPGIYHTTYSLVIFHKPLTPWQVWKHCEYSTCSVQLHQLEKT